MKKRYILLIVIVIGLLLPEKGVVPVKGASPGDWNPQSFWYYPWGSSVTHKGVDIFAEEGTPVVSSTYGIVLSTLESSKGGKSVLVLGPKWRVYYYAHLHEIETSSLSLLKRNSVIGSVGTSGNAAGKPPHLHYSIVTLIPYPWLIDNSRQGWKKMFYLNPLKHF